MNSYQEYRSELVRSTTLLAVVTSMISVLAALLNFVIPLMLSSFIENYGSDSRTGQFLLILGLCYLLMYLAKMCKNLILKRYAVRFKSNQHMKLLEMMFRMKYDQLNRQEPTYLAERIAMCTDTLFQVYGESVSGMIVAVLNVLLALAIILPVSVPVALILVVLLLVQVPGYRRINRSLQEKCVELQKITAENFKNILSVTSQVDYIKQEGSYAGILRLLAPFVRRTHLENARVNKFAGDISTTLATILLALRNLVYLLSAVLLAQGRIDPAEFVLISMVSTLYMSGLGDLVNINISLRDVKGVREFIEQELMACAEEDEGEEIEQIDRISFDIHRMGYGERILIQEGVFEAVRGDVVMLYGDSGSGKTTLMKGLLKLVPVKEIRINGTDIRQLRTLALRSRVQFFSQNIPVIAGTIRDNISMGREVEAGIWELLKEKAFLKKFYDLPDGLDTRVLENGSNLSGGDRQKLALARLYLEDPDVIILDESTNSLDEATSYELISSVVREFPDRIIFVISHDSDIRKYCNKVAEIRGGRLNC